MRDETRLPSTTTSESSHSAPALRTTQAPEKAHPQGLVFCLGGYRMDMEPERDPANPTPEELRETAASEGLMATEEETDPEFEDDRDPVDVPDPEIG